MNPILDNVDQEVQRIITLLIQQQQPNGSWHYCFENGTTIDALFIILCRSLQVQDELLIRQLHDRIVAKQQSNGSWRIFDDEEEGNLSASVEAYYALLYSGYSNENDQYMQLAKQYIRSNGGLNKINSLLTKAILAATGQIKWPTSITLIPLEILLFPTVFPIDFFDFSGYSRIHLVPMLLMANQQFAIRHETTPNLSHLNTQRTTHSVHDELYFTELEKMYESIHEGVNRLIGSSRSLHDNAKIKAEQFMLDRLEADGTLYSYASSTILMIFSLLALNYDVRHPIIAKAIEGITAMKGVSDGTITLQNSPSTIWDTALLTYALQEAGMNANHPVIEKSAAYLISKQQNKLGDWSIHNPNVIPGGWGFSESNTINPDVDDSTAALRAIYTLSRLDTTYSEAWNRGLNWVISMQNKDGGWPAFEKNTNKAILTWIALDGAKSAATDPSESDLTGRTLEYLGNFAGLNDQHNYIKRGADWIINHQEKDGSWYGRWGICYIYGTWAALTGLTAVGLDSNHEALLKGAQWLTSIQNADGGWGESCKSDQVRHYVPLGASTPSQTAWALDALIAVHKQPTSAINKGISRLISLLSEDNWTTSYPTGAALPYYFYVRYHSYQYIWPLVTLSHYKNKYSH